MTFSQVLAALSGGNGHYTIDFGDDWLQGRSVFGGLLAAVATRAVRSDLATDLPLRQLTATFIAAVNPGLATLQCSLLRRGKSVILARCDILQQGELATTISYAFGSSRRLDCDRVPVAVAPQRQIDDIREVRYVEGVSATFAQHFGHRWAEGAKPGSGGEPRDKGYLRHRDSGPLAGEEHIIALADGAPSPVAAALTSPVVASSLTWTLDLLDHNFSWPADQWFRLDSEVNACRDGYVSETRLLVNPDNQPVALSHQCVVVYQR